MSRYILSPAAERDLESIHDFIARDSPRHARRVIGEIRDVIRGLARWPMSGHFHEDLTSRPLRFKAVYSYYVIYRFDVKPIHVLRIVHGSRNIRALLEREME